MTRKESFKKEMGRNNADECYRILSEAAVQYTIARKGTPLIKKANQEEEDGTNKLARASKPKRKKEITIAPTTSRNSSAARVGLIHL